MYLARIVTVAEVGYVEQDLMANNSPVEPDCPTTIISGYIKAKFVNGVNPQLRLIGAS